MHSLVFAAPPRAPTGLTGIWNTDPDSPKITLTWTDNSTQEAGFTVQRALDPNFTNGLVKVATLGPNLMTYEDTTPAKSSTYYYRVLANGQVVGDVSMAPRFPTMSADSVSNTAGPISTSAAPTLPAVPTLLTAIAQKGPMVSLTWTDNADNESGFKVERCLASLSCVAASTNWAQIAAPGPNTNTYIDATVTGGNSYSYRVAAVNAASVPPYTYSNTLTAAVAPIPAAPTSFTVAVVKANGNYTATLNWTVPSTGAPTDYTIQRATNLSFTTDPMPTFTAGSTDTSLVQLVNVKTTYYYRIRANNNVGDSSAWTNALPFPIRTGN